MAEQLPLLCPVFGGATSTWDALVAGAVVICALGAVDDRWGLDALTKLAGQVLAAGVMAVAGRPAALAARRPGQRVVAGAGRASTLLTVLVVVVTINAVNFVDGLDGLAAGIVGIAAVAFFAVLLPARRSSTSFDRATPGRR